MKEAINIIIRLRPENRDEEKINDYMKKNREKQKERRSI